MSLQGLLFRYGAGKADKAQPEEIKREVRHDITGKSKDGLPRILSGV